MNGGHYAQLFKVQNGLCVYCDMPFATREEYEAVAHLMTATSHVYNDEHSIFPTIDHVMPRVYWDNGGAKNYVLACAFCNVQKCDMIASEYILKYHKGIVKPQLEAALKFINYPFTADLLRRCSTGKRAQETLTCPPRLKLSSSSL